MSKPRKDKLGIAPFVPKLEILSTPVYWYIDHTVFIAIRIKLNDVHRIIETQIRSEVK